MQQVFFRQLLHFITLTVLVAGLLSGSLSVSFGQADAPARIIVEPIEGPTPWTSLDPNNHPETFQFAIVSDRTGGNRPGIFMDGIRKLNLLQPEFVMSVGDFIQGYTQDPQELDREWKEFNGLIKTLEVPFFYVPGNHDYTNEVQAKKWKELFGRSYYHFVYKEVLFLCLNSEDHMRGAGRGSIGDEQYEYIRQTLQQNQQVKWTLVFMHQPLWNQADPMRWKDVESLLAERKHTVFVGHNHRYVKYERNNGKYFILATTGGGSQLRGPRVGEFDHVSWITMTDEGPIMANISLDGIWNENVVTEELANLVRPLLKTGAITLKPVLVEDTTFQEYETELRLTNNSDVPMEIDLSFLGNTDMLVNIAQKSYRLAPNSVEVVNLAIQTLKPVLIDSLENILLKGSITYLPDNMPEVTYETQYHLRPEYLNEILPARHPVNIDGKLGEWDNLSYQIASAGHVDSDPFSHRGPDDASFRFDISYDQQYLYLAARVLDDERSVSADKNPFRHQQDGISFFIDPRPERISAMETGDSYFQEVLVVALSPVTSKNGTNIFRREQLPEGTQAVCLPTDEGFTAEVAIPLSYLDTMQGGSWESLRLNAIVNDYDQQGNYQAYLFWKPDWRSKENYIGSGILRKSSGSGTSQGK